MRDEALWLYQYLLNVSVSNDSSDELFPQCIIHAVCRCVYTLQCLDAVCVCWGSLLYEVKDLDGVGHPEEDCLQVWDQV